MPCFVGDAAMWLPSLGRGRSFLNRMGKIFLNYRQALLKLCDYLVNFQNQAHQIRSKIDASRGTNSTTRLLIPSKVTFQPSSRMGQWSEGYINCLLPGQWFGVFSCVLCDLQIDGRLEVFGVPGRRSNSVEITLFVVSITNYNSPSTWRKMLYYSFDRPPVTQQLSFHPTEEMPSPSTQLIDTRSFWLIDRGGSVGGGRRCVLCNTHWGCFMIRRVKIRGRN
jgi:hypothetical protein